MTQTLTMEEVIANISDYSWKNWVYCKRDKNINSKTECIVIDPDEADLGSDNFTPSIAEELGMDEFLCVQDISAAVEGLRMWMPNASQDHTTMAVVYYFENDAFLTEDNKYLLDESNKRLA